MKRFVYLLICLFVYLFIPTPKAQASGEFQADYAVEYSIAPTGTTIVTQQVTLTNTLTNLYARQYSIVFDTTHIKNIVAYDTGGPITPTISQKDGKTEILLTFNTQVTGVGKQFTFTLRFENDDIAKKLGSIWEVSIPGVADSTDLSTYFVTLLVPPSFGNVAYMSPIPAADKRWSKEQMTHGGIVIAYGSQQSFSVDLTYYLENTRVTPLRTEIALPPDTAFQTVTINSLDPKPETIDRDPDGNWLAQYTLGPRESRSVAARLVVTTHITPKSDWKEPNSDMSPFVKASRYWQTEDTQIQTLAKTYTTPRAIYDYVVSTLSYSYARVNQNPIRKGALAALQDPTSAICMEFTDLFIALARAAGIPARENVGFAYTTNTKLRPLSLVADILHTWPEYYDREKHLWIPIDPTWADTTGGVNYFDTLDFNHITFAIQGTSPDYPYPAGFYRQPGKETRDVAVSITQPPSLEEPVLVVSFEFPATVIAGLESRGQVLVKNSGKRGVQSVRISVQSSPVDVATYRVVDTIPPSSTITIPVAITIPYFLYRGQGRLTTTVNDITSRFAFAIRPTYWLLLPVFLTFAIIIVLAVFFVWRPKRKQRPTM